MPASEKGTIMAALSGGVDSSMTALLLREAGWNVVGVHMRLFEPVAPEANAATDLPVEKLGEALGIPFHILPLEELFEERVVSRFITDYRTGRTPNPCVECNRFLKFGALLGAADRLGIEKIATGHYARITRIASGRLAITAAADSAKNQAYYLYGLTQEALSRTIFPLGEFTKGQVREMARSRGLPMAEKSESQEICFVPENDYRLFLEGRHFSFTPGRFLDRSGNLLGRHDGKERYTIGQRKGLGIAWKEPLYVLSIRENGDVIVGPRSETVCRRFHVEQMQYQGLSPEDFRSQTDGEDGMLCRVQIRYRSVPAAARVRFLGHSHEISWNGSETGDLMEVELLEDVFSVTPGQSAVFFPAGNGNLEAPILGGGIIQKEIP